MTPSRRPTTVHIAAIIQAFVVVLSVAAIVLAWLGYSPSYRSDWDGAWVADDSTLVAAVVITFLSGLTALWFGLLLIPTWLGNRTTRLMTIAGAVFYQFAAFLSCVCGGLFSALPEPFGSSPTHRIRLNGIPQEDVLIAEGQWLAACMCLITVSPMLIALVTLLVVPPSHRWYAAKRESTPATSQ